MKPKAQGGKIKKKKQISWTALKLTFWGVGEGKIGSLGLTYAN